LPPPTVTFRSSLIDWLPSPRYTLFLLSPVVTPNGVYQKFALRLLVGLLASPLTALKLPMSVTLFPRLPSSPLPVTQAGVPTTGRHGARPGAVMITSAWILSGDFVSHI
jgi:hypothetical protein